MSDFNPCPMSEPKTADQWFAEYGESHQNDTNELIHWICVPTIFYCVFGLIWSIPVGGALGAALPWFNWTLPVALGVLVFYMRLSMPLAVGMFLFMGACFALIEWQHAAGCPVPIWQSCLGLFVLAWIGQFIGHKIEGKKPSFFKDIVFLLIGPAWLMHFIYKRLGWRY
jgi:uncharacterized membrane protein YGL010W